MGNKSILKGMRAQLAHICSSNWSPVGAIDKPCGNESRNLANCIVCNPILDTIFTIMTEAINSETTADSGAKVALLASDVRWGRAGLVMRADVVLFLRSDRCRRRT